MGGKLLKNWNLPEKRLDPDSYKRICDQVTNTLISDCSESWIHCAVPLSLRKKESHGDIDIFVSVSYAENYYGQWREQPFKEYIHKVYGYIPHQNSNVFSFPVEDYQIDVTFVPCNDFDSSINYASWGDTSNLLGRIFHKMGLHFGHSGLSFWIRQGLFDNNINWTDNDHIYEKFIISKNQEDILQLGGFDYNVWKSGFDTEEDAFQFVISGDYFDPSLFALENLNHINRVRNKKRGMYMRFVEYIADKGFSPKKTFLSKENYSLIFQEKFPFLKEAINDYRFEYQKTKIINEKFNGRLIMEKFQEISGIQIGKLMNNIRKEYSRDSLLTLTSSEISDIIQKAYSNL
jgi:hypothetical protein